MNNKILDDLIQEAMENPDWKAASALRCAKKELLEKIDFCGKWISVKDMLPDEDTDVLVANGLGIEIAAYTTNPVKQWYGMNGQDVYVKYWMPLPEPPKEEEHATD